METVADGAGSIASELISEEQPRTAAAGRGTARKFIKIEKGHRH